jgi:hypothetical protein
MSGLLTKDFKDFITLLQKHKVKFLICGGHAVGFYGYPRLTMGFDLLFRPTSNNAEKIMNVLKEFGFGDAGIPESAFLSEGTAVTLGVQPNQIDLLTSVSSINTESIFNNAVKGKLEDFEVLYISKYDLIQCKKQLAGQKTSQMLKNLKR